jgi:hypothetical protein
MAGWWWGGGSHRTGQDQATTSRGCRALSVFELGNGPGVLSFDLLDGSLVLADLIHWMAWHFL